MVSRERKLAELILDHSLKIREREYVMVCDEIKNDSITKEIFREALRRKAIPYFSSLLTDDYRNCYGNILRSWGIDEELPDVDIIFRNRKYDPKIIISDCLIGREPLKEKNHRYVLVSYPTERAERDSGIPLPELENIFYRACLIDWEKQAKKQEKIKKVFDKGDEVKIEGKNTDLLLKIEGEGRSCLGETNIPDGEVYYNIGKDSVEGIIFFDLIPHASGRIRDVKLEFRRGKIVKYSAKEGKDILDFLFEKEKVKEPEEFGIGANSEIEKITSVPGIDEKMSGTIHLGLESDKKEDPSGEYKIHWDIVKDLRRNGKVYLNGELVQKDGEFLF